VAVGVNAAAMGSLLKCHIYPGFKEGLVVRKEGRKEVKLLFLGLIPRWRL